MKEINQQKDDSRQNVSVQAIIHKPKLLNAIVREIASQKGENKYSHEHVERGWSVFNSISPETYITGKVVVSVNGLNVPVLFDTCFLFTCIKSSKKRFNPEWSLSLS